MKYLDYRFHKSSTYDLRLSQGKLTTLLVSLEKWLHRLTLKQTKTPPGTWGKYHTYSLIVMNQAYLMQKMTYAQFVTGTFESVLAEVGDTYKIEYEESEDPVRRPYNVA